MTQSLDRMNSFALMERNRHCTDRSLWLPPWYAYISPAYHWLDLMDHHSLLQFHNSDRLTYQILKIFIKICAGHRTDLGLL